MDGLKGRRIHGKIMSRLERVGMGNLGDTNSVGGGVSELKTDFGPGYRVYFGQDDDLIVLLGGGTKGSQTANIAAAKRCWDDYNA